LIDNIVGFQEQGDNKARKFPSVWLEDIFRDRIKQVESGQFHPRWDLDQKRKPLVIIEPSEYEAEREGRPAAA
jgi:hypothetical protein